MLKANVNLFVTGLTLVGLFPFLVLMLFVYAITFRVEEYGDCLVSYADLCVGCGLAFSGFLFPTENTPKNKGA